MPKAKLPSHAQFKGHREVVIQDIRFEVHNTKFLLERYFDPKTQGWIDAQLPPAYRGSEYGPQLRAYAYMSYYQGRVPQNKIEKILNGVGVQITDSEIGRMLIQAHPEMQSEHEKARITALSKCDFVQVDDTGARIIKDNGHTIVTSNPYFCSFLTSLSKDRHSVVQALSGSRDLKYLINRTSFLLLKGRIAKNHLHFLKKWAKSSKPLNHQELTRRLRGLEHLPQPSRDEIETACAIAAYRAQKSGNGPTVLVSDDAGNFKKIFPHHQLCWVHELRRYKVIPSFGNIQESFIQGHPQEMRELYRKFKRYKLDPTEAMKKEIEQEFDRVFQKTTPMSALNEQLRLTMNRKKGLLMALKHPFVPLHNNESETDLRERVLKRRISYGNKSWAGVNAWDLQMGLLHTCRKNGISYWEFLKDRFAKKSEIPKLHQLIQSAV